MAYETENTARRAAGLPLIRTASFGGAVLPMPTSWKPRPAAPPTRASTPPARAPSAALSRNTLPLVWIACGLSGTGTIKGRGHGADCEAFESSAVARAADRINSGAVGFRLSIDHGDETLATVADGGLAVRHLGGDLLVRWRPRERDRWVVDQIREREHDGNSVGASIESRGSKATTSDGIRVVESADIVCVSILLRSSPAFWRSGCAIGGTEGDVHDYVTAVKWLARCDAVTR